MKGLVVGLFLLAACGVEKMPPIRMVNRGAGAPHRAIVLPSECVSSQRARLTDDPSALCQGLEAIVASDLAFRGVEILDLQKLPARERTRTTVLVSTETDGGVSERRTMTVSGPTLSDVDMWTSRDALAQLGVDTLVRVRVAWLPTYPIRVLALVRMVRPENASVIAASICELEVSRLDLEADTAERATRCALRGLAP